MVRLLLCVLVLAGVLLGLCTACRVVDPEGFEKTGGKCHTRAVLPETVECEKGFFFPTRFDCTGGRDHTTLDDLQLGHTFESTDLTLCCVDLDLFGDCKCYQALDILFVDGHDDGYRRKMYAGLGRFVTFDEFVENPEERADVLVVGHHGTGYIEFVVPDKARQKKMELLSRKADQEDREAQERYEEARQKYEKARDERELTQSDEIELVEPPPPKKKTGLFGSERLNRVMDVGLTPDLFTAPGEGPEDLLPLVAKTLKPKTGELQSKRGREKLMTTRAQKLFFMDKPIVPANEAIEKYSQFLSDNPDKTAEELDSGKWYQKVVDSPDALVVLNWREMFTALSATQARLVIFSICNGPKSPFVKEDPSVEDMQKSLSFSDERDDNSFYYAYIRSNCVADRSQIRDCLTGSMSVVLTCLQAAGFVIRRYDGEWTSDE